jgi:hypothetical protein
MSSTSAVDQKRKENNPSNGQIQTLRDLSYNILILGIVVLFGTLSLYICRGSQTNLFPTCVDFAPYTMVIPDFSSNFIETNVNIVKGHSSTKMGFSVEENMDMMSNHSAFAWLRNFIDGPKSNQTSLYFASIMQNILALNFTIINGFYQFCNSFLSETMIVFFVPWIAIFVHFGLTFVDGFYFIYLWFSKLPMFCSYKKETGDPNVTTWQHQPGAIWNITNWWKIFIAIILFFFGIAGLASVPFVLFGVVYSVILPLMLKTEVGTGSGKKKEYGPWSLFKDVLKFKRNILMYFVSFILLSTTSSAIGMGAATSVVIICIGLYFFTDVYHPYEPKDIDNVSAGLASYVPSVKKCGNTKKVEIEMKPFSNIPSDEVSLPELPKEVVKNSETEKNSLQKGGWKNRSSKNHK